MFSRVSLTDDRKCFRSEIAAVVELAFDEGLMAFADAVDVAPGLRGVEGEFVGGGADDWACVVREKGFSLVIAFLFFCFLFFCFFCWQSSQGNQPYFSCNFKVS